MKLLAIDTATEGCSATLLLEDEMVSKFENRPRKHADLILPMIETLLGETETSLTQLDAMAFGRGPGAFTGVRIATGVTQGIAYALDLPVLPVSTLQALAQRAYHDYQAEHVLSAFDARMGEVYWGGFQLDANGFMQQVLDERVVDPARLQPETAVSDWAGAGGGWKAYADILEHNFSGCLVNVYGDLLTRSDEIAVLGQQAFSQGLGVEPEAALPGYLRNQVAWKKQS